MKSPGYINPDKIHLKVRESMNRIAAKKGGEAQLSALAKAKLRDPGIHAKIRQWCKTRDRFIPNYHVHEGIRGI